MGPGVFAEGMAVSADRIVAVGANHDVAAFIGPSTRVINLRDRLAIPAVGDAHIHAVSGGLEGLRCDLLDLQSRVREELTAQLRPARQRIQEQTSGDAGPGAPAFELHNLQESLGKAGQASSDDALKTDREIGRAGPDHRRRRRPRVGVNHT
jgi:predicted amidohydrolase YtcJ